jgi:glycosyltransferase involved in cell wall biosynthesis
MSICFISWWGHYQGGGEKSIYETIKALGNYDVKFVAFNNGELVRDVEKLGIETKVYKIDLPGIVPTRHNFINLFTYFFHLKRTSEKICENANMAIANSVNVHPLTMSSSTRLCFVRSPPKSYYRLLLRIFNPTVIYNSSRIQDIYGMGGHVLPPPIDMDKFRINTGSRKRNILYVGRLVKNKCISHLFEAVRGEDVNCFIVGSIDTDYAKELRVMAPKNVHFLGYRDDIPELMGTSSLVVLPSYKEPFGRIIPEALATGTPVLCSHDAGCLNHLNIPDEMVYEHGSIDEMKYKIGLLLKKAPKRPRELREIAQSCSHERYGERIRELIEGLN